VKFSPDSPRTNCTASASPSRTQRSWMGSRVGDSAYRDIVDPADDFR
jgi:hypothetical protein